MELKDLFYPVVEHFYTLQGEGAYAGHAAYFIRLGGCDVGCPWCDTKESWDASLHPQVRLAEMKDWITASKAPVVVITGGEPAMHDLAPLTNDLAETGARLHLETSGAYPITGRFDWVTVSPKKFKPPLAQVYPLADELKIVVFNQSDFKWAMEHAAQVPQKTLKYLQPEWDKSPKMLPAMLDFIKTHPDWRLSLQTHKYLQIP